MQCWIYDDDKSDDANGPFPTWKHDVYHYNTYARPQCPRHLGIRQTDRVIDFALTQNLIQCGFASSQWMCFVAALNVKWPRNFFF